MEPSSSVSTLELFREVPLRTVADKIALVDEIRSDVVTPKVEQLNRDKDALKERYSNLAEQVEKKLEEAKEQDEIMASMSTKLNNIKQEAEALAQKYGSPQELPSAVEDTNRIGALLEELPELSSAIDNLKDRQRREQLAKIVDTTRNCLKVSCNCICNDLVDYGEAA